MRPIRIVLEPEDLAGLVAGMVVLCGYPPYQADLHLCEMSPGQIAAIVAGDPRACLNRFGNDDPGGMSVADLRAHAGYLQASGALSDSAAYATAADVLEARGGGS